MGVDIHLRGDPPRDAGGGDGILQEGGILQRGAGQLAQNGGIVATFLLEKRGVHYGRFVKCHLGWRPRAHQRRLTGSDSSGPSGSNPLMWIRRWQLALLRSRSDLICRTQWLKRMKGGLSGL